MKQNLFVLFMILLAMQQASAAINVSIGRNPVHVNESFQMVFASSESLDDDPDFSPLQQHFVILNTSQNSSISIINGDYQRSIKWTLQVMPKQVGEIIVPAIHFGDDKTEPFRISVKPASSSSNGSKSGLIFELSADRDSAPVQGQIIITMRLMSNTNFSAYQFGDLMVNNMDVVIEPLGEVKRFQTRLDDQAYLVLEKKLALFPQQSGDLSIDAVPGEVRLVSRSSSVFDPFQTRGEIKRVYSPPLNLEIHPLGGTYSGQHWLPATNVRLSDVWQGDLGKLVAGEPVTRTLMLVAEGLTAAQLPALQQQHVDGLKQYPDQPLLEDQRSEHGMVGIQQQKIALIPTRGGVYQIPEITVPWWNTTTQRQEVARIPSRTIQVAGDVVLESQREAIKPSAKPAPAVQIVEQNNRFWVWLSLFLAVGWLVSGLVWWFRRRGQELEITAQSPHKINTDAAIKALQQSCEVNDAKAARAALLSWARALDFENLAQLAAYFGQPIKAQIDILNQSLYSNSSTDWQGNALWRCSAAINSARHRSPPEDGNHLPALNP
ncbi:MAG: protein BatD [Gammaproteobacteria bacterium]|nr:protein BatD [Gammaproteobacteria bacterium]